MNEWSDSSDSMDVRELDWSPQERAWGKSRQEDGPAGQAGGGAGPSASADFHTRPGETYDDAMRRVHNAAQLTFRTGVRAARATCICTGKSGA